MVSRAGARARRPTRRPRTRPARLLLTCEHAGRRIPRAYAHVFRSAGARAALASHRGHDAGALALARVLARRLGVPLHQVAWSRLLVDANRSPHNPRIWSPYTKGLSREEREQLLARYYWPHRREVEEAVRETLRAGRAVVHVAVHSFTPVLDGKKRELDIGLLYDPRRPRERALARRWQAILRELAPELRVRRNQPYLGVADGLSTWLRRRYRDGEYAGVELEVSQGVLAGPEQRQLGAVAGESLRRLMEREPRRSD